MPLSNDRHLYFVNKKKFGIPTVGEIYFKGKLNPCENNRCLTLYDIGRGHFQYHTNWFWASFSTRIGDKTVSLNFGDGIGHEYENKTKFYEDFLNIDGKQVKLDQTDLEYDEKDFMKVHTFTTVKEELRVYQNRSCSITFTPVGTAKDGVHLAVAGMT